MNLNSLEGKEDTMKEDIKRMLIEAGRSPCMFNSSKFSQAVDNCANNSKNNESVKK